VLPRVCPSGSCTPPSFWFPFPLVRRLPNTYSLTMVDSVTFLGTSDGLPSTNRKHASLLVRIAGRTVLLDCGEPCSHTLKRMGVDFNSIDAVVISHTHSDHVAGFPMLVQSMWLERRRRPLPVWIPRHAIRPLQNWLRACYLFDSLLPFRIQWRPLSERSVMRCG